MTCFAAPPPNFPKTMLRPGMSDVYAAIDLGTNNCRLLIAQPWDEDFRVIDAFSRIVRLGEGLAQNGALCQSAIERTMEALRVCREKMSLRGVTRSRLVATEACRSAANGEAFLEKVRRDLGLHFEIIDQEMEAHLAVMSCRELIDTKARSSLLFDIGGGSCEVVWLARKNRDGHDIVAWESLRLGVISLSEVFGYGDLTPETFAQMVDHISQQLAPFVARVRAEPICEYFHLIGTSGTATTLAALHLNLPRYDRRAVDGLWLNDDEASAALTKLQGMSYAERAAHPCIGERADLMLAGVAILRAILNRFPANRLRIADRGLREGLLRQMIEADRALSGSIV